MECLAAYQMQLLPLEESTKSGNIHACVHGYIVEEVIQNIQIKFYHYDLIITSIVFHAVYMEIDVLS